jgi:hypothetical protein
MNDDYYSIGRKHLSKILSEILYRIETYRTSIDVAFKHTCRNKRCGKNLEERELIYRIARDFIANIIKLRCILGYSNRRKLAYRFLEIYFNRNRGSVDSIGNIEELLKKPW